MEAAADTLHATRIDEAGGISGGMPGDPTGRAAADYEQAKARYGAQLKQIYAKMDELYSQIAEVDEVVSALPDHHWQVIQYKFQQNMSLATLARVVGAKSKDAAEKRVQRAVRAFAKAWDAKGFDKSADA